MESYSVNRSIRNVALFAGTICFLAVALGIVLYVHLANVEDLAAHDTSHCTLCQQLFVSKKNYTVEIGVTEVEIDLVGQPFTACPDNFCSQIISLWFDARAPPA
jgi:hypothetical protein